MTFWITSQLHAALQAALADLDLHSACISRLETELSERTQQYNQQLTELQERAAAQEREHLSALQDASQVRRFDIGLKCCDAGELIGCSCRVYMPFCNRKARIKEAQYKMVCTRDLPILSCYFVAAADNCTAMMHTSHIST
jgi:hypothetical protein